MLGIPTDRIVAFFGPVISLIAGGVAAWLVAKVNITGVKGLDQANLTTYIGAGLSFGLATTVTWLGHSKWLTGRHVEMRGELAKQAASIAALASGRQLTKHELLTLLGSTKTSSGAPVSLNFTNQNPPPPGAVPVPEPTDLAEHNVELFGAPPEVDPGAAGTEADVIVAPAPATTDPPPPDDDSQGEMASTDGDAQAPTGPTLPEEV